VSADLYARVTQTIVDSLQRGVVPWKKPWHCGASVPINVVSNRPYRGVNVLLLSLSTFSDSRWLTFNQVRDRGGVVRKGERGTTIVFWKQWEPPSAEDEQRRPIPILRQYSVFNAQQCDGLELPELYEHQDTSKARIEKAELLIQLMPTPPQIKDGGASAWYRPSDDLVVVPKIVDFESSDSYYSTLLHELGHATGHASRLNRSGVTDRVIQFGSGEYSKEELVAELTSCFCCAAVGLDNTHLQDSASYISGWLKVLNDDPKAVVIAAAQAQRAADYIRGITYQ